MDSQHVRYVLLRDGLDQAERRVSHLRRRAQPDEAAVQEMRQLELFLGRGRHDLDEIEQLIEPEDLVVLEQLVGRGLTREQLEEQELGTPDPSPDAWSAEPPAEVETPGDDAPGDDAPGGDAPADDAPPMVVPSVVPDPVLPAPELPTASPAAPPPSPPVTPPAPAPGMPAPVLPSAAPVPPASVPPAPVLPGAVPPAPVLPGAVLPGAVLPGARPGPDTAATGSRGWYVLAALLAAIGVLLIVLALTRDSGGGQTVGLALLGLGR
jgi:hypothetical protein